MAQEYPILYSFRRCPYAMRARLALHYAGIEREHREVVLRDKPAHMLEISPKGTVPVLLLPDGKVIEESLDIMLWAINQNDPKRWLPDTQQQDIYFLIERNDTSFKAHLDRYKYPNRFPDEPCTGTCARDATDGILRDLDQRLAANNGSLHSNYKTLADYAIFPFVRQFAHVDRDWFYSAPYPHLQKWLQENLASELFTEIMEKFNQWTPKDVPTYRK